MVAAHLCLYDADCGFCALCVRLLQRWDRRGRIEFVPNHEARRYPAGVTPALVAETIVVAEPGRQGYWTRSAAIAALLRGLPLGSGLALLLRLPGVSWLADAVYNAVARNRMRISAALGLGVCRLPPRS